MPSLSWALPFLESETQNVRCQVTLAFGPPRSKHTMDCLSLEVKQDINVLLDPCNSHCQGSFDVYATKLRALAPRKRCPPNGVRRIERRNDSRPPCLWYRWEWCYRRLNCRLKVLDIYRSAINHHSDHSPELTSKRSTPTSCIFSPSNSFICKTCKEISP